MPLHRIISAKSISALTEQVAEWCVLENILLLNLVALSTQHNCFGEFPAKHEMNN